MKGLENEIFRGKCLIGKAWVTGKLSVIADNKINKRRLVITPAVGTAMMVAPDTIERVLKPSPDYDFFDGDKLVIIDDENHNDEYFMLKYEADGGVWCVYQYTDKHFTERKTDTAGEPLSEPLSYFGYEMFDRMDNYDIDELR